ncbi:MAG TPA: hypothetical protein VKS20_07810 [Candidatus Acidoferrales bacterium]|nr:hypothetical protein [Candidatus Acidoferrales bacterium]
MAQPGAAPATTAVPITANWNAKDGWSISPPNSTVPLDGTAKLVAGDKNCTFCFSPTDTVFGASQDVDKGTPFDVSVGPNSFTVDVCATDKGQTCPPGSPKATGGYSIQVGSGMPGGGKK